MFKIDNDMQILIGARDKGDTYENPHEVDFDIGVIIGDLLEIKDVCIGQTFQVQSVNRRNGKIRLKLV